MKYQIIYLSVLFTLILTPKILQRFKIPAPLTCFTLGIVVSIFASEYSQDPTIGLLAILGISSLFLFAGLEVNLNNLKESMYPLIGHLFIRAAVLTTFTWIAINYFSFNLQTSSLLALAILTPSTGFILESLPNIGLNAHERFWLTSKAIAGEILALILLFVILKSESITTLASSSGVIVLIIFGLPALFILLNKYVIPHAPNSEFSLLILIGIIAAYITKHIGVYYLVGAFLTGLIAGQLKEKLPNLASESNLNAVKLFASFFVPFYFFYSGMKVPMGALQLNAVYIGLTLSIIFIPARILSITAQRIFIHKDNWQSAYRVSTALTPTLIFTLVISTILYENFGISDELFGGLLIYACITTLVPIWLLPKPYKLDLE